MSNPGNTSGFWIAERDKDLTIIRVVNGLVRTFVFDHCSGSKLEKYSPLRIDSLQLNAPFPLTGETSHDLLNVSSFKIGIDLVHENRP